MPIRTVLEISKVIRSDRRASMTHDRFAGLLEKMRYLEDNRMKSILLQSTIFNSTLGTSIQLDGTNPSDKKMDLLTIDPSVGTDNQLQNLTKTLNRRSERGDTVNDLYTFVRYRYAFDHRSSAVINLRSEWTNMVRRCISAINWPSEGRRTWRSN